MEGQNVGVTIYRASNLADDAAGGARRGAYAAIGTARARIANRRPTLEMRAQGLSTDKLYDAALQPATTDVIANDLFIPADGSLAHVRFRVTSVQTPSMNLNSPRAHLHLQLERWDDGKIADIVMV